MSTITISAAEGIGSAPFYTGLNVTGTAAANETVRVHYEIPTNGVMSADLHATARVDGTWSVKFDGEFGECTDITVIAHLDDHAQATFEMTLPDRIQALGGGLSAQA